MGYAAEKEKVERKRKKFKRWIFLFVLLLIAALIVIENFYPSESWKYYFSTPKITARAEGEMRMHFIDVGQGDATLIELPDGKVMLVDGGDGAEATNVSLIRYLNALNIDTIDYLLATHSNSDHCGGLSEVLACKNVKSVFLPIASEPMTEIYGELYQAAIKENCAIHYSKRSISLSVSAEDSQTPYTLQFLYPYTVDVENGESEEDANASSAVFWLDYMGVSALFTGDAPISVENLLIKDAKRGYLQPYGVELSETEILKVAHHGSHDSTSAEFVEYLGVETAVISCGANNSYGHPSDTVCQTLKNAGVSVYRTDERGNIMITVDKDGNTKVEFVQNA